jgi:NADH:ubiquinone oxidoreductase subunit E
MITFERVNCLGACAIGPILVVDGDYKGNMTVNRANAVVKRLKRGKAAEEGEDA